MAKVSTANVAEGVAASLFAGRQHRLAGMRLGGKARILDTTTNSSEIATLARVGENDGALYFEFEIPQDDGGDPVCVTIRRRTLATDGGVFVFEDTLPEQAEPIGTPIPEITQLATILLDGAKHYTDLAAHYSGARYGTAEYTLHSYLCIVAANLRSAAGQAMALTTTTEK